MTDVYDTYGMDELVAIFGEEPELDFEDEVRVLASVCVCVCARACDFVRVSLRPQKGSCG